MSSSFQKDKIRQRFIDAAKEILLKEGVENVSVRKVGNMCKCSYATIYNYFDNLDHLLWCVGVELMNEIIHIHEADSTQKCYQVQELSQMLNDYARYYVENPNVFRFFFYYQLELSQNGSAEKKEQLQERQRPHLEPVLRNVLEKMEDKSIFNNESINMINSVLVHSIHGLLMMYFSQRRNMTEEGVFLELNQIIAFVTKKKG